MSRPEDTRRRIDLYCFSEKEKKRYADLATAAGKQLSPFLLSKIEEALAERRPASPRQKDFDALRSRVAELETAPHAKEAEVLQLRQALERRDALTFLVGDEAEVSAALIQALKDHGPLHDAALLTAMQIDPKDIELRRAIGMQLEALEEHGRIKKGARGWRWVG